MCETNYLLHTMVMKQNFIGILLKQREWRIKNGSCIRYTDQPQVYAVVNQSSLEGILSQYNTAKKWIAVNK